MNLDQIETKCFILALFIRDDGERFLLGSREYEFVDSQLHFAANSYQNDIVEVQGNDGVMLAGQVRRGASQAFDGYIGDQTVDRSTIEQYRRDFMKFFRKNHYYKVVYVFPDGSAVQRRNGFIVEAPEVRELYQLFPKYHVSMNFEDINYYAYEEDSEGQEIYGESATLKVSTHATGGLIWRNTGKNLVNGIGTDFTIDGTMADSINSFVLRGNTTQQKYSGRNLLDISVWQYGYYNANGGISGTSSQSNVLFDFQEVTEGEQYTASSSMQLRFSFAFFDAQKNFLSRDVMTSGYVHSRTVIAPSGAAYTRLWVNSGSNWSQSDIENANLQIEIGNAATSYEPFVGGMPAPSPEFPQTVYNVTGEQTITITDGGSNSQVYTIDLGSIELCKIGNYQDYIYAKNGDWFVHKDIGIVTDSIGSESKTIPNMVPNSLIYSYCGGSISGTTIVYTNTLTVANTIYYPLSEPTDTQITNSTLVNQLNDLLSGNSYNGTTVFSVTGQLKTILDIEISGYDGGGVVWDSYGAEWEEGTGGGATTITVNSIDNVYPIWELTGPAVNPQISVITTNTTLSYTGSITASQTLNVDMFNKTATLNGSSVINNISGDWVYLKSGVNRVTYTTINADAADSTIWWQEIVG